jgi:hypothetical protein
METMNRPVLSAAATTYRRVLVPLALLLLACSLGATGICGTALAAGNDERPKEQWAVMIGIERYHRASHLRYTINDVTQLGQALCEYGNCKKDNFLELLETAPNPKDQPLRSSIMAQLSDFLSKPGPEDHVLVFFSGHGFRDKEGKLYLAPIDCDPQNAPATGVPVGWLREQIADCRAKFKLLILDACHAGSEKGDDDNAGVSAKELGEPFRDLTNVVTLASSTGDEKSQIWSDMEQSLFTYWLVQGLKGHADSNSDTKVTIDELYDYVHRNVIETAKTHFPRSQTPVRIVRSGTPGVPVVTRLKPRDSLKQVVADTAERLARDMKLRKISKVGVLEFTTDTALGEALGADFGLLGRYCSVQLESQLMQLGAGKFQVVNRRVLQSALKKHEFAVKDLGSTDVLKGVAVEVGGMPVIALGTLRNRAGRVVNLSCDLIQTESNQPIAVAAGTANLNESEWAMLGRSVQVQPEDRRPERPRPGRQAQPVSATTIQRLDERSQGAHPMLDRNFPYRVEIMVNGEERKPLFKANKMFVPLSEGEVYEIWVENTSGRTVMMRLLVDGLNTLPERTQTKGVSVEARSEFLPAQRVNLNEARPWVLDPDDGKEWAVRGFVTEEGESGKLREFKIVDARDSLAARQQFTDQIGIITAAFYAPTGGSRQVGTGFGQERDENIEEYHKKVECGNLVAVVHIHYIEPHALE